MRLRNAVRYLRECYRVDCRTGGILDLFQKKVEHLHFFDRSEQLLCGQLDRQPLIAEDFEPLAKAAHLYRREKTLVYFAFPIVVRCSHLPGRRTRLCAPLLLYPARIEERPEEGNDLLWLTVERSEQRLNAEGLEPWLGQEGSAAQTLGELGARLPASPFCETEIHDLDLQLKLAFPGVDTTSLLDYPELVDGATVERSKRGVDETPRILAACGLALIQRSLHTRGILDELHHLAEQDSFSAPLRALLGEEESAPVPATPSETHRRHRHEKLGNVPAVLSNAQHRALDAAATYPLSLIVGPPGTGKSFTLAAIALDHMSRGQSVLIASRSAQALDVIEAKISQQLGEQATIVRAGRRETLKKLKDFLADLLHGRLPEPVASSATLVRWRDQLVVKITGLERTIHKRYGLELRWGERQEELTKGESPSTLRQWPRKAAQWWTEWRLDQLEEAWRLIEKYGDLLDERDRVVSLWLRTRAVERLGHLATEERRHLQHFLGALRARHSAKQEQLFHSVDSTALLHALPLWSTHFSDAARAIPRQQELFDLVTIDEATQCDIATALPALERGRRAVVTGDPRQLRHVSFLSRQRQRELAERHDLAEEVCEQLDYRDKSLLDLVSGSLTRAEQVVFLDEHYRSAPQIIAFSNHEFYDGGLRIMTRRPASLARQSQRVVRVAGRRDARGRNLAEAEALLAELRSFVSAERPEGEEVQSLGVLSPFRDQVDWLEERIAESLPLAAIEKHQLRVGTAHSFQGDERDVMFLSLVVGPDSPAGSFRFLERDDTFNVSVTRARSFQFVFTSLDPKKLPPSLLRRFLEHAEEQARATESSETRHPVLEPVADRLRAHGFAVWPLFGVAGLEVDLLVEKDHKSVAIDLIGFPGTIGAAFDLERCRILRRAGLPVFPLPHSAWAEDPERCVEELDRAIKR